MEHNDNEMLLTEHRQAVQHHEAVQKRVPPPDIRQYRGVYRTRLILRILSFATCAAIIGVLVASIRQYYQTKNVTTRFQDGSGSYPVWPETVKLRPTFLLLGAAVIAGMFSLLLIVASFHPNVRRMTKTGNVSTIIISSISLVAWVVVIAYYGSWDTKETNWDLLSWSCTHKDHSSDIEHIDFTENCTEMRFAFWGGVGLAGLEAFNLIAFVVWWLTTRKSRNHKKIAAKESLLPQV